MNTPDPQYIADAIRAAFQVHPDKVPRELSKAQRKLAGCIAGARECSRHCWQMSKHRTQYRQVQRESMEDARYWQAYRDTLKARSTQT